MPYLRILEQAGSVGIRQIRERTRNGAGCWEGNERYGCRASDQAARNVRSIAGNQVGAKVN